MSDRARRGAVIIAMAALFVLALGIFVLPFAFPTPPPIVSRFQATLLFSPDGDGRRDEARVNIRLHEASTVSVEIQRDGKRVKLLIPEALRPRGFSSTAWDGTGDDGRTLPNGTYAIKLRARSGEKQFNTTRNIVIDTIAPEAKSLTVESATLAGAGPGECRVVFTAADPGSLVLEALRPDGTKSLRRLGRRPVRAKGVVRWAWDGRAAAGRAVAPGLYVLRASFSDTARNTSVSERTCWVGYLAGRAIPARPAPRQAVGVALRTTAGDPLPPSTPRDPHPAPPDRDPRRHRHRSPGAPGGRGRTRAAGAGARAHPAPGSTPMRCGWSRRRPATTPESPSSPSGAGRDRGRARGGRRGRRRRGGGPAGAAARPALGGAAGRRPGRDDRRPGGSWRRAWCPSTTPAAGSTGSARPRGPARRPSP